MGDYRQEARTLADGFVKGMTEFRKGMEAIAEALAKQPSLTLQIPPTPEKPDDVAVVNRQCDRDDLHGGHEWGTPVSPYWCPGVTCRECPSTKYSGFRRYCGNCKNHENACIEGHCLTCGGLT